MHSSFVQRSRHTAPGTRQIKQTEFPPALADTPVGETVSRKTVSRELYGMLGIDESSGAEQQGRELGCKGERDGGGSQPSGLSLSCRRTVSAKALRWQKAPCGGSGCGDGGLGEGRGDGARSAAAYGPSQGLWRFP